MKARTLVALITPVAFTSCAIVTTPVKVVGKAATTTMDITGKVIGSGFDLVTPGSNEDDENSDESE